MFNTILVPVDLNDPTSWRKSLPVAVNMAQTYGATIHLMCAVPEYGSSLVSGYFPKNYEETAISETQAQLKELVAREIPDTLESHVHVGHGTIYKEILDTAKRTNSDLIVLASHRPELADYLLGPNAARVVRHATQSVMVVRE